MEQKSSAAASGTSVRIGHVYLKVADLERSIAFYQTCFNSVANLRKRGKHIQVGLLLAEQATPPIPMAQVIAHELEILGSHGMQAHRYGAMLDMISAGKLTPQQLVGRRIDLAESIPALMAMDRFEGTGVTIIDRF